MSAARPSLGLVLDFPTAGPTDVGESKGRQTGWASMRGTAQLLTNGFVAEAGYTTWTLDNQDRAFDPLRTSGPYYPDVQGGVDAQMTAAWGVGPTVYPVIQGKVDDFPQNLPNPGTKRGGVVPIRIVDAIGALGTMQLYVGAGGMAPRPVERSGDRVNAVLDAVGWPGPRAVAAGNAIIAPLLVGQVSAWTHLQNVGMAEWGDMYVDGDGTFVFRSRDQIASDSRSITPQATYTDQVGPGNFVYASVDRTTIPTINDCTITYGNNGYQVNAQDATSIAASWGLKSKSLTLPLNNRTQAQQYANWIIDHYRGDAADPARMHSFSSVTFVPGDNGDLLYPELLGRKLSDMVALTLDPIDDGDPITRNVWIRGIAHAFDSDIWKKTQFWVQDASWILGLAHVDVSTVDGSDVLSF